MSGDGSRLVSSTPINMQCDPLLQRGLTRAILTFPRDRAIAYAHGVACARGRRRAAPGDAGRYALAAGAGN